MTSSTEVKMEPLLPTEPGNSDKPAPFVSITENIYLKEKQSSKERKKAKKMVCECTFDPRTDDPSNACGSDCLNRLLMMEWCVCEGVRIVHVRKWGSWWMWEIGEDGGGVHVGWEGEVRAWREMD